MKRNLVRLKREKIAGSDHYEEDIDHLAGNNTAKPVDAALGASIALLPEGWTDWSARRRLIAWLQRTECDRDPDHQLCRDRDSRRLASPKDEDRWTIRKQVGSLGLGRERGNDWMHLETTLTRECAP